MKTLSNKYSFLVLIFFFFTTLCVTAQKDGVVSVQSNEKIKNIINKKKAYNKNLKKIEGFKIQLFYGEEKGAYEIRDKFSSLFPDIPVEIKHANHDWKVWAGAFRTQLEADRVIKEIKEAQFNAFVFATKINI
jgi:hypothetical protein